MEKHSVSRLSYLFAHLHLLSSDSFSSDLLSSNLSLLSASALLCFSSVHIVGSLTSKLPSIILPVVPARGGAEVALKIYIRPFSSIELACAVRQPSRCVRALCETDVLFHMSHLKLHFALRTSHCSLHTPHYTLHTSHCTLKTPHFTLHTPHFTLSTSHVTLHSSHSKLHTSQSTLHTSQSTLLTSHCFLHTPNFTLHTAPFTPHTSHCTLHTPHFISSKPFSPYPSSSLLISSLLICHLSFHESLPSTTNHCRSLDAPTPIRFTIFSCKRH